MRLHLTAMSAANPRRLAAIVSVDLAGYSALAESDAAKAAAWVARLRADADRAAAGCGGRIFSTAGDGLMLEFASASDALEAAFELCEGLQEFPLRFGVHLGEVVAAENGDLLGHGVNIAARLQAQAPTGGVLVSQIVREMAREALAGRLRARGRIKLAKMRETISVYEFSTGAAEAKPEAQPVLAVLPFDNLPRDSDTRFLSDGLAAEILFTVSRVPGLKVIGSTSSFAFRGREKKRAAAALGATHVLDGSVRRNGDRARISITLSEGGSGVVIWAERYERDMSDVIALQDDIADEVAGALALALKERGRALSLSAAQFDVYLRAREHLRSGAPARVAQAVDLLDELVTEAGDFARAWSGLALGRLERMRVARENRDMFAEAAREAAQRAIGLDPGIGESFAVLAALESEFWRWSERDALLQRALAAEPHNPFLLFRYGQSLISTGRVAAGYAEQARAFALDPLHPMLAAFHGYNIWATTSKEEGLRILDDAAIRSPDNVFLWFMRYNLAALDGDFERANALRERGFQLLPGFRNSPVHLSGQMMQDVMAAPTPEAFLKLGEDFTAMARAQPSAALDLGVALSVLGQSDRALALFEEALENVEAWRHGAPDALRPHVGYETALLFIGATIALRMNPGFVKLCARLGLVRYWSETGRWPDCAAEVAPMYDFKAECAKHAA